MLQRNTTGSTPRLGDPTPGFYTLITCRCGHAVRLDVPAMIAKYGTDITFPELRAKLVCSKCGAREPSTLLCLENAPKMR